jgi:ATP-dependent DNA helicase PIF1
LFNWHSFHTLRQVRGGTTSHKWSGIGDDRYLNEEIVHLIKTNERFNDAKDNVQSTNTLIIDEISMISSKVLRQVEFICQKVRSSSLLFGNLQVILAGDFVQLPPVPNELVGDRGLHCFNIPWFNRCFPHKIKLNFIHRQSDTTLIKCFEIIIDISSMIKVLVDCTLSFTPLNLSSVFIK